MELLDRILGQNPHWEGKENTSIEGLGERELLEALLEYDRDKQMTAILGLRRTGKTTLLLQYLKHLIENGKNPKRILYFSFDELLGRNPEIIEDILETYERNILKEELSGTHVFFDEINHVPDWQVILKRYYDMDRNNKFVLTGSSSIYLKKSKESLAGRIVEFTLPPLSFTEYLKLRGIAVKEMTIQMPAIKREVADYLLRGGFPEKTGEVDFQKTRRYVSSIIEKIVYYDIPGVYDVREPEAMNRILELIARKPGAIIDYHNIASALGLTYQTVSKYVGYLEKAFLIKRVYNWRGSPLARARKAKKAYLTTPSLAVAFMDSEGDFYGILPQLVENAVMACLNAQYFFRDYYEIDFLHEKTPVEVKYSDKPEIKGALKTAVKLKSKKLVVITKELEKKETKGGIEIRYLPLWKLLLAGKIT
jgi:hypothetical protein